MERLRQENAQLSQRQAEGGGLGGGSGGQWEAVQEENRQLKEKVSPLATEAVGNID